ncbi:MAG: phage tail sheath C-terminal domain-containing protein [Cyanobacteria bacterium J06607_13]
MARLDYFAPGVYVEEVSRGSRPIQGVNLSVAGFVGFTEDIRGDAEAFEPILITSWSQYLENFAKSGSDGFTDFGAYLPFSVKGWFENGGGRCWVVSLGTKLPTREDSPEIIQEEDIQPALTPVSTTGRRPSLQLRLKPEKEDDGRVRVIIRADEPLPLDDVGEDEDDEPFNTGEYFSVSVQQGGEILETFSNLTMKRPTENADPLLEPAGGVFVKEALQESTFLDVDVLADSGLPLAQRPADGVYEVRPRDLPLRTERWFRRMYGSADKRMGVMGLYEIDEIAMVACPDLMLAFQKELLSLEQVHAVMEMMITGCEKSSPGPSYRMVVLDPPPVKPRRGPQPVLPEQQKPQDVESWLSDEFGRRSQFAAMYYPWVKVPNPRESGKPIAIPPCGHMMGIWSRTDETRGIHKAPANETPRGVLGLAYETNFREQELLNPRGINCIRKFRNRGTLVWGARTLAQMDDTEWRYISVRRLVSYIERSIEEGTQWAVFEPNDEDLWARVTRTVKNFLERIWRQGALYGNTPDEAFYVRCDGELNTPETMKLGLLYIDVGVAPVRPAEFVVFRISQWDPTQEQAS